MMNDKLTDDRADPAASFAVTAAKSGEPESQSTPSVEKEHRQKAIKSLFATADRTLDDKLATVKTAHHVDKDRFQSAFRSLMGK
jgi:transcriptional regulator GlxA family with amidase domain